MCSNTKELAMRYQKGMCEIKCGQKEKDNTRPEELVKT